MYFRRDNRLRRNSFHRLIVFFDAVYLNRLDFYMGRNTRAPPPFRGRTIPKLSR